MAESMTRPPGHSPEQVARVVELYDSTSEPIREAGRRWYPAAELEVERLAGAAGLGLEGAAGIIAALSPRQHWTVNLAQASRLALAAARGDLEPPRVAFGANRRKAWQIAAGAEPLEVLGGPKVRSFYRALLGDREAVTVDVWAALAAEGCKRRSPEGRRYLELEASYRLAARYCDERPRELQAIIWLAVRGDKPADPKEFTIASYSGSPNREEAII
jgi:hypothetical protein